MRMLVMANPQFPVPQEQFPALVQGFTAWREKYRSKMESFYFFAGSGGGFGVVNVASEAELNQLMLEWPFSFYSDVQCRPVLDGDVALQQWQALIQSMAGGAR